MMSAPARAIHDARQTRHLLNERFTSTETRAHTEPLTPRRPLKLLYSFRPHIAILDIGLPDRNGYELAKEFRAAFPDLVLIALSGYGTEQDRLRSRAVGFDHHLTKPGDLSFLAKILSEAGLD